MAKRSKRVGKTSLEEAAASRELVQGVAGMNGMPRGRIAVQARGGDYLALVNHLGPNSMILTKSWSRPSTAYRIALSLDSSGDRGGDDQGVGI
jgi:hypothetical protein